MNPIPLCVLAAITTSSSATAQADDPVPAATFAPPVQLQAATRPLAVGRQAGPHSADLDRDGTPDMLLGDVMGWVFVAKGLSGDSAAGFADPTPVQLTNGRGVKFANW